MKFVGILIVSISMIGSSLFGLPTGDPACFYLRLKFNQDTLPDSLWRRIPLSVDTMWAEILIASDSEWQPVEVLPRKIKVGLVLAGGGDRGIAHIGVIRALEENNIPIDAIAGTSMGAIVGGFYACGYSIDALEDLVLDSLQWRTIFSDQVPLQYMPIWERLRDKPREPGINWDMTWNFRLWPLKNLFPTALVIKPGAGLRTAQKFTDEIAQRTLMADYLAGFQFDRLLIPFGAMLTNMTTRKQNLKLSGTVATAAHASGSLPLVFEPMKIEGVEYVDGMVMDNLPVDAFRRFDKHRAPDTLMTINGDTLDFIIAVDPIKRMGVRDGLEIKPELAGSMGIGVMNQTSTMARDFYIWESWDTADARIDVDVEGAFDFSPDLLRDKIRKGYDAAWKEMYTIKKKLVEKELLLDPAVPRAIYRISSIKLHYIRDTDTVSVKDLSEHKQIFKAISVHEGSYVEQGDLCDILRKVYLMGDFYDVVMKAAQEGDEWKLDLFMRKKTAYNDRYRVKCRLCEKTGDNATAEAAINRAVNGLLIQEKRILNFNETKSRVENTLVRQGYIRPQVDSVRCYEAGVDSLDIFVSRQGRLNHVMTYDAGLDTLYKQTSFTRSVDDFIEKNANPVGAVNVIEAGNQAFRRFNLKTMVIEKANDSTLVIGIERKSGHMIEGPNISLEKVEGISLFGEARCREWAVPFGRFSREWLRWSTYINYTQNFALKLAKQLPQGQKFGMGMQRTNYKLIVPEWNAYWRTLRYSDSTGPAAYNMQFEEYNIRLALPFYMTKSDILAFIPRAQWQTANTHPLNEEGDWQDWRSMIGSQLRLVNLDRAIFPEAGFLVDIDASSAEELGERWLRARAKAVYVPFTHRIQGAAMSVITLRGYMSYYSEGTPLDLRYSMGGLTPIGGYQLRRFDAEDLPGYRFDEFIEPWMWKVGGSFRIALIEMDPLDLKLNLYLVGSYDLGSAASSLSNSALKNNLKHCPTGGIQLDMSYFNIGLIYIGKQEKLFDNFHLSVVFYGLGF